MVSGSLLSTDELEGLKRLFTEAEISQKNQEKILKDFGNPGATKVSDFLWLKRQLEHICKIKASKQMAKELRNILITEWIRRLQTIRT